MAGVDVGGSGGGHKRATNSDINMIPFIDLLMVTISFLLITAVWVTNSRIQADAQVPGPPGCGEECKPQVERTLHVMVNDGDFALVWKREGTVLSEVHVPRSAALAGSPGDAAVRYPELAQAIQKDWAQYHEHFDPNDRKQDVAVLHSDNRTPFRELVAVLDAINGTRREIKGKDGAGRSIAAFTPTFSVR
jgi:biopolymer transport protein ExbD